jgi:beta-glucanase (GH16 family)
VLDDEFNEQNLSSLFYDANSNPSGLWSSLGQGWNPAVLGVEYDVPAPRGRPTVSNPTPNTALTSYGTLKLTARKDPGSYPIYHFDNNGNATVVCAPYTYTGALLWSVKTFLYGYFEIRAKIPNNGKVIWPAFWLWDGGGNQYREIDDFEFGANTANNIMGMNEHLAQALDNGFVAPNHHTDSNTGAIVNDYPGQYQIPENENITNDFHVYAVKWSPNSVVWYVDDQPVRTLAGHSPHMDMNLIADIAINFSYGIPDSVLPADFEIDYIRAYTSQSNEFMYQWGNGGSGKINWWDMNPTDR